MSITRKDVFVGVKEYVIITLGLLGYVLGWTIFLVPNNLIGGGVTGISAILQYATGIKIGYSYFVINAVLLIAALITLGKGFGVKTVYAIIVASAGLNFFQAYMPQDIINALALENGKLMSTIMGGTLAGVGIGITMSQGGSTGGTDIIALIVNKYRNVSPGRMILAMDVFIIMSSLVLPSYTQTGELVPITEKITTVVYGLMYVLLCSTALDLCLTGSRQSVQLMILSKEYEAIADAIANEFHRGVTILDGQGWYTKQPTKVVMVITRKTDLTPLLRRIKSIDSNAFLSVSSVTGVYGKGFDTIKGSKNAGNPPKRKDS